MDRIQLRAYAKINLGLDVLGKRDDGYHEVRMIMQTVRIFDKIQMEAQPDSGIAVHTNLSYLPENENNLAYKAAKLLWEEYRIPGGISIDLKKHIPVAAGMAGGSSDAAAVLYGVNRMYGLGLSLHDLMERGVRIGADVPYCIMRGTAMAEGIGEKLTPLPPMPHCYILIAKPSFSVSTAYVYGKLHVDSLTKHPDIDGITAAISDGDLKKMTEDMRDANVLETVTVPEYPIIADIKEIMDSCGAMASLMSGSGPTVFGIFDEREAAGKAADKISLASLARQIFITEPYNPKCH